MSTQTITLDVPVMFEIPTEYLDTTPQENAAILLLGRSVLSQLKKNNYNERITMLEDELRDERMSTERFKDTLKTLTKSVDQSVERAVDKSFEELTSQVEHLAQGVLEKDRKDRDDVMNDIRRGHDTFEQRLASINTLLDRFNEIEKRIDTSRHTNSARGRDNEIDSHQTIVSAFGTVGAGFQFHPKNLYSGDHVFDWNGLRIMWEDKLYKSSVPKAEIEKGLRDVAGHPDCHVLLFVSATSDITGHESMLGLTSEVQNGQLILYISNFKRNTDPVGYLRTVVQTILTGVKPLLLNRDTIRQENNDERLKAATIILTDLSMSLAEQQRACDGIASDFRARLTSLKNSIDRVRSGIDSLSKSLLSTNATVAPDVTTGSVVTARAETQVGSDVVPSTTNTVEKKPRRCGKCGQPGHTRISCKA
jgi:uncharacterized coiled-coil protein SlyX